MTSCRSVGWIGVIYLLIGLIGAVEQFPRVSVLPPWFHWLVGVWALIASRNIIAAVTFSRKAALLFGLLVVVEVHVPLSFEYWLTISYVAVHIVTALAAAYYGYYRTDAVEESVRRKTI